MGLPATDSLGPPVQASEAPAPPARPDWRRLCRPYASPDLKLGLWQATSGLALFALTWAGCYLVSGYSLLLAVVAAIPAAMCVQRVSSIQHECGHNALMPSRRLNDAFGFVCGLVTFSPYHFVKRVHTIHHSGAGKMSLRGVGDHYVLTTREYLALPKKEQLFYRFTRSLFGMFVVNAFALFFVVYRFSYVKMPNFEFERRMLWVTNAVLAALVAACFALFEPLRFFVVHLSVIWLASAISTLVTYMQHNFETTYFAPDEEWDYYTGAMVGSSYWKLPPLLEWVTMKSGWHHLHHLAPRIPNYHYERCARENPELAPATTLTLGSVARCVRLFVWDEQKQKMITLRELNAGLESAAS